MGRDVREFLKLFVSLAQFPDRRLQFTVELGQFFLRFSNGDQLFFGRDIIDYRLASVDLAAGVFGITGKDSDINLISFGGFKS